MDKAIFKEYGPNILGIISLMLAFCVGFVIGINIGSPNLSGLLKIEHTTFIQECDGNNQVKRDTLENHFFIKDGGILVYVPDMTPTEVEEIKLIKDNSTDGFFDDVYIEDNKIYYSDIRLSLRSYGNLLDFGFDDYDKIIRAHLKEYKILCD